VTETRMEILTASTRDAPAISALALSVAHFFTLDKDGRGAEAFLQTLQPEAVALRLQSPSFKTWVGWTRNNTLAGVVVVREDSHLFHLFVAEAFQGLGYGQQLWQHALSHIATGPAPGITVNATPHARGFYERMGFLATGPRVETRGVAFIPMRRASEASSMAYKQAAGNTPF